MGNRIFSVILLPTAACNAACTYCFEHKEPHRLPLALVPRLTRELLDHLEHEGIEECENSKSFQVNTPFPSGPAKEVEAEFDLDKRVRGASPASRRTRGLPGMPIPLHLPRRLPGARLQYPRHDARERSLPRSLPGRFRTGRTIRPGTPWIRSSPAPKGSGRPFRSDRRPELSKTVKQNARSFRGRGRTGRATGRGGHRLRSVCSGLKGRNKRAQGASPGAWMPYGRRQP